MIEGKEKKKDMNVSKIIKKYFISNLKIGFSFACQCDPHVYLLFKPCLHQSIWRKMFNFVMQAKNLVFVTSFIKFSCNFIIKNKNLLQVRFYIYSNRFKYICKIM